MAQQARQYAQRNREGSDWFSHDGDVKPAPPPSEPVKPTSEPPTAAATSEVAATTVEDNAVIDQSANQSATATEPAVLARAQMIRPKCDSNEWYKYDHGGSGEEKSSSSAASGAETSRREKEGAAYCRRDKTGSAAQWFSHDHVDNDVGGGQKTKSVSGGSVNAARMRSESDCWYNYDKAASQDANTAGVQKKRGAGVKPGSNEMHGVFHHAN